MEYFYCPPKPIANNNLPGGCLQIIACEVFSFSVTGHKLSQKVNELIANSNMYEEIRLSAISLWGFSKLIEKKRVGISCDPEKWIKIALDMPKLRLVPLSPVLSYRSTILPQPFHNDPADQMIVATAREENATILTKDEKILTYENVSSLW